MQTNTIMVINRETAMRLWNKAFGKNEKAVDFSGREIAKAAYDDRNSKYGWNIDHILPQSRGGKTTESNLICCHIKTNDEKADKFPCFSANGEKFEIVKVQNHYEIKNNRQGGSADNKQSGNAEQNDFIDFYDSAAGVRFFKELKGIQNKQLFVGKVIIRLNGITTAAILDFISEIFRGKSISYSRGGDDSFISENDVVIQISDYNMPEKADIAGLLDKCVLANTYLSEYFAPTGVVGGYQIYYGVHSLDNKVQCLVKDNSFAGYSFAGYRVRYPLAINELVKINTDAAGKLKNVSPVGRDKLGYDVYEYNYIFTNLAGNLKKEIK